MVRITPEYGAIKFARVPAAVLVDQDHLRLTVTVQITGADTGRAKALQLSP